MQARKNTTTTTKNQNETIVSAEDQRIEKEAGKKQAEEKGVLVNEFKREIETLHVSKRSVEDKLKRLEEELKKEREALATARASVARHEAETKQDTPTTPPPTSDWLAVLLRCSPAEARRKQRQAEDMLLEQHTLQNGKELSARVLQRALRRYLIASQTVRVQRELQLERQHEAARQLQRVYQTYIFKKVWLTKKNEEVFLERRIDFITSHRMGELGIEYKVQWKRTDALKSNSNETAKITYADDEWISRTKLLKMRDAHCVVEYEEHCAQLNSFLTSPQKPESNPPLIVDDEEECDISKIVDKRKCHGVLEYRVRWIGGSYEEDEWFLRSDLLQAGGRAPSVVNEYEKTLEVKLPAI